MTLPCDPEICGHVQEGEGPLWRGFPDEEVVEFPRMRLCLQRNILIERAFQKA